MGQKAESWWDRKQRMKKAARKKREALPFELFKFQRPLSFLADPSILIYNESRVHTFSIPYNRVEAEALFQGAPKVYVWGRFNHDEDYFEFDTSREPIRNPEEFPEW